MRAAIFFGLFALASAAWAQTYDAALAACRAHSVTVPASDPGKVLQAQEAVFQGCVTVNLPDPQKRQLALFNEKSGWCNQDADNAVKLDKLITAAERKQIYVNCMAGHRYIVQ